MAQTDPEDAIPWVGLYVFLASLVCTLAMAADVFTGFRQRKLWFPCRFFTINAASITLIAIATKLPVDLSTDMSASKSIGIIFLVTMIANFLPSLGLMNEKELLMNMTAFGLLIITIIVNVWIQCNTIDGFSYTYGSLPVASWNGSAGFNIYFGTVVQPLLFTLPMFMLICSFLGLFSVALIVPASRKLLQHRYKELQRLDSSNDHEEINFSSRGLIRYVKKYWMMAETGDPQFAVACSPVSSAFGVICLCFVCILFYFFVFVDGWIQIISMGVIDGFVRKSEYKWSMRYICISQSVGVIVGSIAPVFRCLSAISHFSLSRKWSVSHLNVFIVEKYWTQILQDWKRIHVRFGIPGRNGKKIFHSIKNMILNIFIGIQITIVVTCKTVCVIPRYFLILFTWCWYFCNSLVKRYKEPNSSDSDEVPDLEEYIGYVVQTEAEGQLSKRILRNSFNSITRLLHECEEPRNLLKLLNKSTGFYGVIYFDNDEVPPLHREEIQNCWSLVTVTLTAIAISLPNISNDCVKGLLAGMSEAIKFVTHIEGSLNTNGEMVKARKTAKDVWIEVELYSRWLQIDLQKKSRQGETSGKILQWLGDEAVEIVKQFNRSKIGSLDHSISNLIASNSMYRCSQTLLRHCNEQEIWPTNEELFDYISIMIADLLCACFTNLPRVIILKCHADAIEKREDSIRTAAQLLGESKKILEILEARKLPNLDLESMAYIDKWHVIPKSQIPDGCSSSSRNIQPASSSSSSSSSSSRESIEVAIE
ncbi:hypothetical protein LXL04_032166 [Taraxacum kok-saghyz]